MKVFITMLLAASTSAAAQKRTGMLTVPGAQINYEWTGPAGAKTVVLVHGWANTLAIWDNIMPAFTTRYRVLRYDRRGYGASTGFADPSADPDDLRLLMDSLGIRSAYVVGLSAGARMSLRFAFAFPERADALVYYGGGPPPGFPIAVPENRDMLARIAREHGLDSLGRTILASPIVWLPPGRTAAQLRADSAWFWDNRLHYNGRDLTDPHPESGRVPPVSWTQISSLSVPTLLVNGDHDLAMARLVSDSLARRLPRVQRTVILNAGHAAHLLEPERFSRSVLEFFAARDRGQERSDR